MNGEAAPGISYLKIRFSMTCVMLGLLIFAIGAKPSWFGWERTPVVGFIQIAYRDYSSAPREDLGFRVCRYADEVAPKKGRRW